MNFFNTPKITIRHHMHEAQKIHAAIASVVNDDFVPGFICMERSLRRTNPDWNFPIFVVYCNKYCKLSRNNRNLIKKYCENIVFHELESEKFADVFEYARNKIHTPARLLAAFYILECFSWDQFDVVITLDSDMVILGPLSELLVSGLNFGAVRAYDAETNQPREFINTGVMVLGKKILSGFDLARAISGLQHRHPKAGTGKADQAILNMIFGNLFIDYLPRRFNYTKRMVLHSAGPRSDRGRIRAHLQQNDIRVLHYVGEKPWNPKVKESERDYALLEEIWHEEFAKFAQKDLKTRLKIIRARWVGRHFWKLAAGRALIKQAESLHRTFKSLLRRRVQ